MIIVWAILIILFVPFFPLAYYSNKIEDHLKPQYRQKPFERRTIYYNKYMFIDDEGLKYKKKRDIIGIGYGLFVFAAMIILAIMFN
jgi:hypothetical protein